MISATVCSVQLSLLPSAGWEMIEKESLDGAFVEPRPKSNLMHSKRHRTLLVGGKLGTEAWPALMGVSAA